MNDGDPENLPTDLLPTIATFLDFEGAITPMGRKLRSFQSSMPHLTVLYLLGSSPRLGAI